MTPSWTSSPSIIAFTLLLLISYGTMAWRLALARPYDHGEAKRLKVAEAAHARQARSADGAKRQLAETAPAAQISLVCMSIPGTAAMLNVKAVSFQKASIAGMIRLAVTPRVRGSGAAVGSVRKLQNQSAACVASTALACQRVGLNHWLQHGWQPDCEDVVKGLTFMWDEAAQKMRGIFGCSRGGYGSGAQDFVVGAERRSRSSCASRTVPSRARRSLAARSLDLATVAVPSAFRVFYEGPCAV